MGKKGTRKAKKDRLKIVRIAFPCVFAAFIIAKFLWIDAHSESNWMTYLISEESFLAQLAFGLLVTILSMRRWKFAILWLGLTGLAFVLGGHPSFGSRSDASAKSIKVLTYNVAHFDLNKPGVIDTIRQSNADLIFIQEACTQDRQKQTGEMLCKELKGYRYVSASSNMILSRYPIKFERLLDVPTKWPVKQFPIATVQSPLGPIRVISVHMEPSWVGGYPPNFGEYIPVVTKVCQDRQAQVDLLLAALRPSKIPVIMAGDFNGTPGSESIRRIGEYFKDSYATTEKGFGMTLLPQLPYKRIDYVWTKGLRPISTEVLPSKASDHMPVLAQLSQ